MTAGDKAFTGSIPALYERHLVPLFFAPYADDLAGRLASLDHGRLLELAAGTGAVTRVLARRMPAAVAITATDLNPAMLDMAAKAVPDRAIEWRAADACALPFEDARFDAVVCQFGAMFFPDKSKAFREARRVLAPHGAFLFSVWDRIEANDYAMAVTEGVAKIFPDDPPNFFARMPHGYHDVDAIRRTLQEAGFSRIEADVVEHAARAPDPRHAAIGLCQGSPLRNEIEARDPQKLEAATEATERVLREKFGDGAIGGRMRAIVFSARG